MKLLPQHQNSFSFSTILLLSLCNLILFVSYMPIDVKCVAGAKDNKSNDRLALLAFKNEITQDPLGILSSWNDKNNSLHFCKWRGVTCNGRHRNRVSMIDLRSQKLVGSISSQIGNLSFLRNLILNDNNLYGEIPQHLGRLFRLRNLVLSLNSLEGEIPHNITLCSNLRNLNISDNKLVGSIPKGLGYLSNLKMLWLGNNNLSGEIPTSLGNLSSLIVLALRYNNLEGRIPNTLRQLTRLRLLGLDGNKLSGIVPSSLYNISTLETFSLMSNQLHGSIPFDIGFTLPNLEYFSFSANDFTGTIPSSFCNMSRLKTLQLSLNNFVGSVPNNLGDLTNLTYLTFEDNNLGSGRVNDLNFLNSLVNCTNLRFLAIRNNSFGGMLPSSIANLTNKLNVIDFGMNIIYGSIPTGIQNLVGLTNLVSDYNLLTSSLPPGIGNLKNLGNLDFRHNKFSGSIPSTFGNLTRLIKLVLYENNLTGLIPSSLGYCEALQVLNLEGNRLTGSIPEQVFKLPSLSSILNLANNSLTGTLPVEVGNLKNIGGLFLSGNKLSGEIPSTIGKCLSLTNLYLDGNFFQGNIPPTITLLKGLEILILSHNNLSGIIPKGLENLSGFVELDLSFNNLEGAVPKDGVFENASRFSIEGNSKLCGGIPVLKLPNCPIPSNPNKERKHMKLLDIKVTIIIIVVVVSFFTLVVLFITVYWRKKSKIKLPLRGDVGEQFKGVSYSELLKATNGFNDSTNLLGVGSFGSVYKGILHDHDGSKPIAVKVLHLQQKGATKSFMAECDVLRKIRHRNLLKIVTCCSSTDYQGNPFKALVFEFMANGSLDDWLHPAEGDTTDGDQLHVENLNLERRLSIAVDVASALNYLHHDSQSPIVHCDVKPSNVLLDDDLIAHVGDFGLAKFLFDPSSNSIQQNEQGASSIAIKGSIGYVSPEYGMGGDVSTQGDVYSYGILLLEMFTGKRPTDDMFKDGLNIHDLSKMHKVPERVEEVIDSRLLLELMEYHTDANITNYNISRNEIRNMARDRMRQILASIIQIGVKCSSELPSERSNMNEVLVDLQAVKNQFLGVRS